jgi:hypothetical protein
MTPFVVLLALVIVETLALATWQPAYFRKGLRVFQQTVAYADEPPSQLDAEEFTRKFCLTRKFYRRAATSLEFRRLNESEIAFREPLFQFYTPVMHGLIRVDPTHRLVYVSGYANWTMLAFVACILVIADVQFAAPISLVAVAIMGAIYAYQAGLYRRVATHVAEIYASQLHIHV